MTELPSEIFQKWYHSFEEDRDDIIVYRPPHFPFPIARGRDGIEFRRDGEFIDWRIPPADGPPLAVKGRWQMVGPRRVRISFEEVDQRQRILEIIRCDEEKLEVQQQPDSPLEPNIHANLIPANLYELTGENTRIVYITDPPQLHYQGPGVHSGHDRIFSGTEAALRQSEIGSRVEVTLEPRPFDPTMPPLDQRVTLSIFVPPFNLRETNGGTESSFETLAILTIHPFDIGASIGGPASVEGAVEFYRVLDLKGRARRIEHPDLASFSSV
jgi:hypothetical protein